MARRVWHAGCFSLDKMLRPHPLLVALPFLAALACSSSDAPWRAGSPTLEWVGGASARSGRHIAVGESVELAARVSSYQTVPVEEPGCGPRDPNDHPATATGSYEVDASVTTAACSGPCKLTREASRMTVVGTGAGTVVVTADVVDPQGVHEEVSFQLEFEEVAGVRFERAGASLHGTRYASLVHTRHAWVPEVVGTSGASLSFAREHIDLEVSGAAALVDNPRSSSSELLFVTTRAGDAVVVARYGAFERRETARVVDIADVVSAELVRDDAMHTNVMRDDMLPRPLGDDSLADGRPITEFAECEYNVRVIPRLRTKTGDVAIGGAERLSVIPATAAYYDVEWWPAELTTSTYADLMVSSRLEGSGLLTGTYGTGVVNVVLRQCDSESGARTRDGGVDGSDVDAALERDGAGD